jgi:hypothetical protein
MTVADDRVADLASEIDRWECEYATGCLEAAERVPAVVGNAERLSCAAQPIMLLVLKLGIGDRTGEGVDNDADWAVAAAFARRVVLAHRDAGFDVASTARNLALIDRIGTLVGDWPEPDWSHAVVDRVSRTADARRRGRARGECLSRVRDRENQSTGTTAGWLLRHPADHYFLQALRVVSDAQLSAYLKDWVAALDLSYAALSAQDWSFELSNASLVAKARVIDPPPPDWTEPIRATVLTTDRGGAPSDSVLALRQVADPQAPFNGRLCSMLADEHWLICGDRLDDSSVLVGDGTRRLQRAG